MLQIQQIMAVWLTIQIPTGGWTSVRVFLEKSRMLHKKYNISLWNFLLQSYHFDTWCRGKVSAVPHMATEMSFPNKNKNGEFYDSHRIPKYLLLILKVNSSSDSGTASCQNRCKVLWKRMKGLNSTLHCTD